MPAHAGGNRRAWEPSSEADLTRGAREPSSEADLTRGGREPSSEADLARGGASLRHFGGSWGPPRCGSCCARVLGSRLVYVLRFLQVLSGIPPVI
jgi:hypothetical protein